VKVFQTFVKINFIFHLNKLFNQLLSHFMSTQISQIILFYSKFSKQCEPCGKFITQNKLPITMVALDTEEERQIAKSGELIQIHGVPTMVVYFQSNEKPKVIETGPSIINWLQDLMGRIQQSQQKQTLKSQHEEYQQKQAEIERQAELERNKPRQFVQHPSNNNHQSNGSAKNREIFTGDDSGIEISEKKPRNKKLRKKTRKNEDEDEGVELILSNQPPPDMNSPSKSKHNPLSTDTSKRKSPNANIMDAAKKMQAEREQALGHWENRPRENFPGQ
jgi:hypothetical protein